MMSYKRSDFEFVHPSGAYVHVLVNTDLNWGSEPRFIDEVMSHIRRDADVILQFAPGVAVDTSGVAVMVQLVRGGLKEGKLR